MSRCSPPKTLEIKVALFAGTWDVINGDGKLIHEGLRLSDRMVHFQPSCIDLLIRRRFKFDQRINSLQNEGTIR